MDTISRFLSKYYHIGFWLFTGFIGGIVYSKISQHEVTEPISANLEFDSSDEEDEYTNEPLKMTLVVRTDLKMSPGKIAAQCAHASLDAYRQILKRYNKKKDQLSKIHYQWVNQWLNTGAAKIVLQTNSLQSLKELQAKAKDIGVPNGIIMDAGKTEIAAFSITVLSVGPAPVSLVDKVTKKLRTL